ncbi:MAG: discoidin domain-containing protein [Aeriscardovia sp.]|nr:discoidin domain-containing protein [Aeriscardovia sp.]
MGNRFKCTLAHGGSGGAEGNTLIVTCDPDFAGVTISASKSGTTYTQTCPSIAPYTVTFHGLDAGTWDISATVSGDTYSTSVTITDFTALLSYGFNWATWVTLGGLDPTDYSDLSDVFADEAAVRRLMLIHASADYLISAVTDDVDVIDDFCANDTAMKWIGLRDYVCDGLTAINGVEAKFLASQYWERYLKDHVPTMTSNTAPYGTASGTSVNVGNDYWKAFDKNSSTGWISGNSTNSRIIYKFTNPICVKKVSITPIAYGGYSRLKDFKVQGSNDGTTWNDLYEGEITSPTDIVTFEITNNSYYMYYSVLGTTANQTNVGIGLAELQFYGRSLNVSVPVMTGNTSPYGECLVTNDSGGASAYKAFDNDSSTNWGADISTNAFVGYDFGRNVCIKQFKILPRYLTNLRLKDFKIEVSEDKSTWEEVYSGLIPSASQSEWFYGIVTDANLKSGRYCRLLGVDTYGGNVGLLELQFYGVDYSEREFEPNTNKKWLYDHGLELEPISEAITTGGTITFGDDFVTIDRTVSANLSIATDSAIDLTNYNKLFAIVDTTKNSSVALIGCASARNSGVSSMTANKVITSVGAYVKDCLDISTVDTSQYPILNANNTGTFNVKELWLEQ